MENHPGITLLGLGPGDASLLTRQAWDWLGRCGEVHLRTRQHPAVAGLPAGLEVFSFDAFYENGQTFEETYAQIVERVLELGRRPQGVTYAVPGHPFIAETTGPEIMRQAQMEGLPVRVIEGMSFLEPVCTALGVDYFPHLALVDALELGALHHPNFPPDNPALVAQVYSRQVAAEVKLALTAQYPDEHPVRLVHGAGTQGQLVEELPLYEIDRSRHTGLLTVLFVPPLGPDTSLERFQEVIAHLRAPDGCPWDMEQTHLTLRKHLLEETYEALDALDTGDVSALQEELGDLLLQIVLHAQIAAEEGEFTLSDVLFGITTKIVRRHPHVFGEVKVDGVKNVLQNWEKLKAEERKTSGQESTKGLLDGVPSSLPALAQAWEIQDRAARVGFDWDQIEGVWQKVHEELEEVRAATTAGEQQEEIGDLLFAVINLARWMKVDGESALRATNVKFRRRFAHVEQRAREAGKALGEMKLAEMDVFWDEAKKLE
jgi:tetrapyrrole methylase family protein/MazG family protein